MIILKYFSTKIFMLSYTGAFGRCRGNLKMKKLLSENRNIEKLREWINHFLLHSLCFQRDIIYDYKTCNCYPWRPNDVVMTSFQRLCNVFKHRVSAGLEHFHLLRNALNLSEYFFDKFLFWHLKGNWGQIFYIDFLNLYYLAW